MHKFDPDELIVAADLLEEKGFDVSAALLRELHEFDAGGIQGMLCRLGKPDWQREDVYGDPNGLRAYPADLNLLVAMDGERAYWGVERWDGDHRYEEAASFEEAKAQAEQFFAEHAIEFLENPLARYRTAASEAETV